MNPWTGPHTQKCQYSILPCHDSAWQEFCFHEYVLTDQIEEASQASPFALPNQGLQSGQYLARQSYVLQLGRTQTAPEWTFQASVIKNRKWKQSMSVDYGPPKYGEAETSLKPNKLDIRISYPLSYGSSFPAPVVPVATLWTFLP